MLVASMCWPRCVAAVWPAHTATPRRARCDTMSSAPGSSGASVIIGDTLVTVDCYTSPWTADLDRGVHSATRNRVANLRRKLAQWDGRWSDIARNHSDLLPSNIRHIVPVVVSTLAEWIDDDSDPSEWLEPEVPRICTAHELDGVLSRAMPLAGHPAAIEV